MSARVKGYKPNLLGKPKFEDVWLESLHIESLAPDVTTSSNDAISSLDVGATLAALQTDANLRASAAALVDEITAKLPRGLHTSDVKLADELDALLNDARALVLGRAALER